MRIAFVVERPTQFEAPFYRHAAADPGHELRVLFTGTGAAEPVFDPELDRTVAWGIDLLGGYPHALRPPRGLVRWLRGELRRGRWDLVIANGYTQPAYLAATALARRRGIPTALRLDSVRFGGAAPRGAREALRGLVFAALRSGGYDLFLGVGSLTLDYLRSRGVPEERTGLFPYAVDVEHFRRASRLDPEARAAARARLGVPAGARAVLAVAKLNSREGPGDLLRALPASGTHLHLLVAGDGPDRAELQRLASELAPGHTTFLGYLPYPELPALYGAADLFVHAAREERWGVSVQEALACGLPVVASSRVGAAYDLISPGRNGFLYRSGDPEDLALRLREALALPAERVQAETAAILARWDYAAAWQGLLAAASRVAGRR